MTKGPLGNLIQAVRKFARSEPADVLNDGQLLTRFLKDRDETSFQALVQRHGPSVLSLCRRMLGDAHLAEDAFQATFLVLARRAGAITRHESLGSWLYGVAYRVALKARQGASRRQIREQSYSSMFEPSEEKNDPEMSEVLEQELQRLPEKYRAPLLLCYLEGKTKSEAARQLGWSDGAVHGRLERAREKLRLRLSRRGFVLPTAGLIAILANHAAPAAVPMALLDATTQSALLFVTGRTTAGLISIRTLTLTEGVLNTMWIAKMKMLTGVVALAAVLGAGVANLVLGTGAAEPGVPAAKASASAEAPAAKDGKMVDTLDLGARLPSPQNILFNGKGRLIVLVHEGGASMIQFWDLFTGAQAAPPISFGRIDWMKLSPDGNTLAISTKDGLPKNWVAAPAAAANQNPSVRVFNLSPEATAFHKEICTIKGDVSAPSFAFSDDGRTASFLSPAGKGIYDLHLVEMASRKEREKQRLKIPLENAGVMPIGRNDTTLVLAAVKGDPAKKTGDNWLFNTGAGQEMVPLENSLTLDRCVFSPDGRVMAGLSTADHILYFFDAKTGKLLNDRKPVKEFTAQHLKFTPDGKSILSDGDGSIKAWDVATGKMLTEFKGAGANERAAPGVGGALGGVPMMLPANGRRFGDSNSNEWLESADTIGFVCSPDSKRIAYFARDASVRVCEIATGKELQKLTGHKGIDFEKLQKLKGVKINEANVEGIMALSPDGKTLVSALLLSHDKVAHVWQLDQPSSAK